MSFRSRQHRAPLAPPAIALCVGIWLSHVAPSAAALATAAISATIGLTCLALVVTGRAQRTLWIAPTLLASSLGYLRHQAVSNPHPQDISRLATVDGTLVRIEGRVISLPVQHSGELRNPCLQLAPRSATRFTVRAERVHTTQTWHARGNVAVSVAQLDARVRLGERVQLTGMLSRPAGRRNFGEPDWAAWQRNQGISASCAVDPGGLCVLADEAGWFDRLARGLRSYAAGLLLSEAVGRPESSQLLDAMVLGQRTAVSRRLNELFVRTGSVHVLSVSGFHLAIVVGFVWFTCSRLVHLGNRLTALVTVLVITAYALIVEPNAPALRCVIMTWCFCLAAWLRRPMAGLNWLALACILILLVNPLELMRPGFQLSFVQVAALMLFATPSIRRAFVGHRVEGTGSDADTWTALLARWLKLNLWMLFVTSAVAWLSAMPLVLLHFGRITPLGWLYSVLLTPAFACVIVAGFAILVISGIAWPIAGHLLTALLSIMDGLVALVERLAHALGPLALVEAAPPPFWLVILTYAVAGAATWLWRLSKTPQDAGLSEFAPPRRDSAHAAGIAGLLIGLAAWIGWIMVPTPAARDAVRLVVMDVGDGSAAALLTQTGKAALVDAGTLSNFDVGPLVRQTLRQLHVDRLEHVLVSHDNLDHYSGIPGALEGYRARMLRTNPYAVEAWRSRSQPFCAPLPGAPTFTSLAAGERLNLDDLALHVLWPPATGLEDWRENDRSLVLRVEGAGKRLLIPGDIERAALKALSDLHAAGEIDLRADVLIAPHHGDWEGGATRAFYAAVDPQVVLISGGRERTRLLQMIRDTLRSDCRVISTRDAGAMLLAVEPDGALRLDTPFAKTKRPSPRDAREERTPR